MYGQTTCKGLKDHEYDLDNSNICSKPGPFKNFMRRSCQITCGTCNDETVQIKVDCKDHDTEYIDELESTNAAYASCREVNTPLGVCARPLRHTHTNARTRHLRQTRHTHTHTHAHTHTRTHTYKCACARALSLSLSLSLFVCAWVRGSTQVDARVLSNANTLSPTHMHTHAPLAVQRHCPLWLVCRPVCTTETSVVASKHCG